MGQLGFFDADRRLAALSEKGDPLEAITALVPWESFQGGLTVYNLGQKCRHLGVNPIQALECNCVSDKVAVEMAISVCKLFTSDWGIAITGYSTPVPESDNKLFAYFAIAFQGRRSNPINWKLL